MTLFSWKLDISYEINLLPALVVEGEPNTIRNYEDIRDRSTSDVAANRSLWDTSCTGRASCTLICNDLIHYCCHISYSFFEMMPVVCDHIFFCHINLDIVTHCDTIMQVFELNIIIVLLSLIIHGTVRFHKIHAVGFKTFTMCSSILESLQDILRDSHPFFCSFHL